MPRITTNQERLLKDRNVFGASLMNAVVDAINSFHAGGGGGTLQAAVSSLSVNNTVSVAGITTLRAKAIVNATAALSAASINNASVFGGSLRIVAAKDVQVAQTTGTKIGTLGIQKIGFWGKTPVVKPGAVTSPAGVTANFKISIDGIITRLKTSGIMAATAGA